MKDKERDDDARKGACPDGGVAAIARARRGSMIIAYLHFVAFVLCRFRTL